MAGFTRTAISVMYSSPPILDNALDAVGHTPLIRLDRIARREGIKCNLLGKVEYLSAGGSVKDRIAKYMVEAAEEDGTLIPGKSVVIEPTSGNTGIGLAIACAIKGYSVIVTMPNSMSLEKGTTLRALGAEVVRTPAEAAWDSPASHIGVAHKLAREIPHGVTLDQYRNVNNPRAHELTTGPEIINSIISAPSTASRPSSERVDVFVAGAGTGGTITGVSRAIKKASNPTETHDLTKAHDPKCVVVGVDPKGSILAFPDSLNTAYEGVAFAVEGIGHDFVPDVLSRDPADIDTWIKTSNEDSWGAVRFLMRTEGLLIGGSSGSALSGALSWLKTTKEGQGVAGTVGANVVVLLPDGIRNYMSKPWFLEMTTNNKPSPLADVISKALGSSLATESILSSHDPPTRVTQGLNDLHIGE